MLAAPPRTSALTAPPGVGGASGARLGGGGGGGAGAGNSSLAVGGASSGSGSGSETGGGIRRKVALAPGCSALDWAREKSSGKPELRAGLTSYLRITPSELAKHKSRQDCWTCFNGKVYNLSPYLRFHPGGEKELMRVAGRDGTRLFMLTHSWVNIDAMIDATMIGMMVPEH
ncbi:cytochrome b5 [Ceraceosorus guamensis]|uniref:Cytochrome b5 n=1 Tax=Ceraceosorus guamensis TaxID=1522189 RepID=A0A316VRE8_9BASI|nr:cytochrome b5 [Ceraceosorus guamensis]PWN39930.1 cytochrome b5 [Ceraceosorus guamensis]